MISPQGIALRGYLGDSLSIAVDGYIYPAGENPFISNFVGDFVTDFVGNFVSSLLSEDDD